MPISALSITFFVLRSAPEQKDVVTLHIRTAGGWTSKLYQYFKLENEAIERENSGSTGRTSSSSPGSGAEMTWRKRLLKRVVKSVYILRGRRNPAGAASQTAVSPATLSTIEESIAEDEEMAYQSSIRVEDDQHSLFSNDDDDDDDDVVMETAQKKAQLGNSFSFLFDPDTDVHNFWSTYRYLTRAPNKILFDDFNHPGAIPLTSARDHLAGIAARPKTTHSKLSKPLEVFIDGPHGAPSSAIFAAEHAVLVATGIGVTPFASILQSIMHRYWESKNTCPQCSYQWSEGFSGGGHGHGQSDSNFKLKKVDFIWINREQKSFEWFLQLLSQLEMEQAEKFGDLGKFLDIHLYITSVTPANDFKAVTLHLALDLMHKKTKRDLITGLKTRTNAGRPDWDEVFKRVERADQGKVTVFYCGNPVLASTLVKKCNQFNFSFKKEIF